MTLKCFEVLQRLKVRQDLGDNETTLIGFLQMIAEAEMETAPFLDDAGQIVKKMLDKVEETGVADA